MGKMFFSIGILMSLMGTAHASSISGHCVPQKADPEQYGPYLSSFDIQVYSKSKVIISNPELGKGRTELAKINHEAMPKLPSSDSGTPTNVKKPLPTGVERFSGFQGIAREMNFSLVTDIDDLDGDLRVVTYWRSSDDMRVKETYRCE